MGSFEKLMKIKKNATKGLPKNKFQIFAHKFVTDLAYPIEQNRRNSSVILRILRLRISQRCGKVVMQKSELIFR